MAWVKPDAALIRGAKPAGLPDGVDPNAAPLEIGCPRCMVVKGDPCTDTLPGTFCAVRVSERAGLVPLTARNADVECPKCNVDSGVNCDGALSPDGIQCCYLSFVHCERDSAAHVKAMGL